MLTKNDMTKQNNLNELEQLFNFMKKHKIKLNDKYTPYTHTMMYAPYGKYFISGDNYKFFLKLYENTIIAGYKPHIIEQHKEYGPVVIDFVFVQSKKHNKRYYTVNTIRNSIQLYNTILKKYLNIYNHSLRAYVSEKKNLTFRNGEYHDGIHIIYPHICTKPSLQMLMRKKFLKLAKRNNIFGGIPLINDLDNDLEGVFDKNVIYDAGWLLYGSRKNTSSLPYYMTHIYGTANNKIFDMIVPGENLTAAHNIKYFINILSCRRFSSEKDITPLANGMDCADIKIQENTSESDSKRDFSESKNINHTKTVSKRDFSEPANKNINYTKTVTESILSEAQKLVSLFSSERAFHYDTWVQVGSCLYNIDHRLLDDWIKFSKKSSIKFKDGECENLWKKMKTSNYTMATLHYFASKDNPDEYLKMKEEKISTLFKNGFEASHNPIAKLLIEKYKFVYKCASITKNHWYEFKDHKWISIDNAYTLRMLISNELIFEYGKQQAELFNKSRQEAYDKNKYMHELTQIPKLIKSLNNNTFKNGVIHECAEMAHDPNFIKKLDENIYLICFENGVYDLLTDTFRDGCPDDYISLCTNYKYIKYDKNNEVVQEIKSFLKKIQPDKIMRHYLMTLLSTCLSGSISEESFYVFTGSGANGKSKLMELLKYTLGDLFKPMDVRLLTEKRSSSSTASPELADKKGIRVCPFDEPESSCDINTGFMKIFTGGDTISARALYNEPIYFKPQFKPVLLCNRLPNIKSDDDGTWRRLKVIPFLSKFINPIDAAKIVKKNGHLGKNQFWADNNLSEKLPEWKQIFMGMLINYYKKYKANGLVHPKVVTKETAEYRRRCDVFQDFISGSLEKTEDPKNTISIIKLYEHMRTWHRANLDGKCPTQKDLRDYIKQRVPTFNPKTDALTCYIVKTTDDDNAPDDLDNNMDS